MVDEGKCGPMSGRKCVVTILISHACFRSELHLIDQSCSMKGDLLECSHCAVEMRWLMLCLLFVSAPATVYCTGDLLCTGTYTIQTIATGNYWCAGC